MPPPIEKPATSPPDERVILLHGLVRTPLSMWRMERRLKAEGYTIENIGYPSRKHPIQTLAKMTVGKVLAGKPNTARLHFVTHSLGGILVRTYLKDHPDNRVGRVVMLAPPNQGCELVDHLKKLPLYRKIFGEAGTQLGTHPTDLPKSLGAVEFCLGVIAGTCRRHFLPSTILPKPHDGRVSVASTRVIGLNDFICLPASHGFITGKKTVIEQTLHFLRHGHFRHSQQAAP